MGQFKAVKKRARQSLAGRRLRAAVVVLLTLLPGLVVSALEAALRAFGNIPAFLNPPNAAQWAMSARNAAPISMLLSFLIALLSFLVTTPVRQGGNCRWFYRLEEEERDGVAEIFHYFESFRGYLRVIRLYFVRNLRILLWSILFFAVPVGIWFLRMWLGTETLGRMEPLLAGILPLWALLAALLLKICTLRYFLAPYLMAVFPTEKASRLLRKSVRMMRGNKGHAFLFWLSYWWWFLPGAAAAGAIVAALVLPQNFLAPVGMLGIAMILAGVQVLICYLIAPARNAAFALYARELIYGWQQENALDHKTREYLYKTDVEQCLSGGAAQPPSSPDPPAQAPEGPLGAI